MGNYIEKYLLESVYHIETKNSKNDSLSSHESEINDDRLNYQIYAYRQELEYRDGELLKLATAKLELTEELIRVHEQRCERLEHKMLIDEWHSQEELTEEIMYRNLDELSYLQNYCTKLLRLIRHLQKKKKKDLRNKKSTKRKIIAWNYSEIVVGQVKGLKKFRV